MSCHVIGERADLLPFPACSYDVQRFNVFGCPGSQFSAIGNYGNATSSIMWAVRVLILMVGFPLLFAASLANVVWVTCLVALSLAWMPMGGLALALQRVVCGDLYQVSHPQKFLFPLASLMENTEGAFIFKALFWRELFIITAPTIFLLIASVIALTAIMALWLPVGLLLFFGTITCSREPKYGCILLFFPLAMISYWLVHEEEEEPEPI